MELETEIYGEFDKLIALAEAGKDLSPVFRRFKSYRETSLGKQISSEQDPYGNSYTPLTETYLAKKRRSYGQAPILYATGAMVGSHEITFGRDSYREGFTDEKAFWHQTGAGRLPQRMLLPDDSRGMPKGDEVKLQGLIRQHFERSLISSVVSTLQASIGRIMSAFRV